MSKNIVLSNGKEIPIIGLGTNTVTGDQIGWAIDAGYRHFDCGSLYHNESEVGQAIKNKIDEGKIKREEIFITGKLWHTDHRPDLVRPAIEKSLQNMNLEYFDLYLMHGPMAFDPEEKYSPMLLIGHPKLTDVDYIETWKEMEKLVGAGLTKSIGLSNFNRDQILRVLDIAKIKPVMNQVECHPYFKQKKMLEFCKSKHITMTAYGPLGSGTDNSAVKDETIKKIADKHKKSVYQVVLRYQIDRGVVVIPKSTKKSHIESNFNVFDFELDEDDMQAINEIPTNARFFTHDYAKGHKYYPFDTEF